MPVKPTVPIAAGDMRVPHDEVASIVSQPSARELPGTRLFEAYGREDISLYEASKYLGVQGRYVEPLVAAAERGASEL